MIEKVELIRNQIQYYETAFWLCLARAALFAIITVYIYFSLKIGRVISQLTGIYRNKEIIRIHQNHMVSGKITGTRSSKKPLLYPYEEEKTAKLYPQVQEEEETVPLPGQEVTQLLPDPEFQMTETVVLGQPQEWI